MMKYLIIPLILLMLLISSGEVKGMSVQETLSDGWADEEIVKIYQSTGILYIEGVPRQGKVEYWEREMHLDNRWVVEAIVSAFIDGYRVGWSVFLYLDGSYIWLNSVTALDTIVKLSDSGYKFTFASTSEVFWMRIYSVDTGQKLLDRAYRHNADSRPYIYEVYDVHEVISK